MASVITVENLSKKYVIRHRERERYIALRDVLANGIKAIGCKVLTSFSSAKSNNPAREEFWALKDIYLEIEEGERVGIIGRNGAGKSTLLKVLSRITEPTTGRIAIKGRVSSLLEVGTGFHPELTGRENIYLNGAILGMTRMEINRKFDEIVDFAGIEKFLDTPVKRYSSGMYVRLAFAVAAHLETEILLVDEVLAVGDIEFQKKCLGKMRDVTKEGRTVLFVSHNMAAVQQLCQRGIVLNEGNVTFCGTIADAIRNYISNVKTLIVTDLEKRKDRKGSQWLKFTKVAVYDSGGNEIQQVLSGQDVFIRFYYVSDKVMHNTTVNIAFNVRSSQGYLLTNLNSLDVGKSTMDLYPTGFLQCAWPRFNLRSDSYDCALFCEVNGDIVDWLQSAFAIQVEDGDFFSTGKIINREQGDVLVSYDWTSHPIEE